MEKDKRKCSEFADTLNNLGARLNTNMQYGDNDLTTWILKNIEAKEGERLLDIGCGDGMHLRGIAVIVGKDHYCTGIDYDLLMIEKSKSLSSGFSPAVDFMHVDMDIIDSSTLSFEDNFFDLIYSVYAFYYSKDEMRLLDIMKRKLKPQGRISIVGPYSDNNIAWFRFLNQFMEIPESIMASTTTFMEGIEKYAHKNFNEVNSKEFFNNITLPSYDALKEYWVANIYYAPKYDAGFEKYAREHFKENSVFTYFKKVQMITMRNKKE